MLNQALLLQFSERRIGALRMARLPERRIHRAGDSRRRGIEAQVAQIVMYGIYISWRERA